MRPGELQRETENRQPLPSARAGGEGVVLRRQTVGHGSEKSPLGLVKDAAAEVIARPLQDGPVGQEYRRCDDGFQWADAGPNASRRDGRNEPGRRVARLFASGWRILLTLDELDDPPCHVG